MELFKKLFVTMIILLSVELCVAGTIDAPYVVGTWSGFRPVCVSYTFDDSEPNQLALVVPMFNEFNYKLTLFTLTNPGAGWRQPNWAGLQTAAAQGHEIANHTVTHPYFNQITVQQQKEELENSNNDIITNVPGYPCG